jgi:hypothetical protein
MANLPESELVRKTFTIKRMDLPPSVQMTRRSLLRWFALSFGLISEKESRDTVLQVLDSLFFFLLKSGRAPTTLDIRERIKSKYKKDVSEKLLRYHLNRLISLELLKRKSNRHFLNSSPYAEKGDVVESFNYWIKQPVDDSLDDIARVLGKLSDSYKR